MSPVLMQLQNFFDSSPCHPWPTCSGLKTETLGLEKSPRFGLTLNENISEPGLTITENGLRLSEKSSKTVIWTQIM